MPHNQGVPGSSPGGTTKKHLRNRRCFFLIYKELDIGKESRPSENIWPLGLHNPIYYGERLSL